MFLNWCMRYCWLTLLSRLETFWVPCILLILWTVQSLLLFCRFATHPKAFTNCNASRMPNGTKKGKTLFIVIVASKSSSIAEKNETIHRIQMFSTTINFFLIASTVFCCMFPFQLLQQSFDAFFILFYSSFTLLFWKKKTNFSFVWKGKKINVHVFGIWDYLAKLFGYIQHLTQ